MTELEPLIVRAFLRLRAADIHLGIGELLAAVRLLREGYLADATSETLLTALKQVWCRSEAEEWQLERIWSGLQGDAPARQSPPPSSSARQVEPPPPLPPEPAQTDAPAHNPITPVPEAPPQFHPIPIQAPLMLETNGALLDLRAYWPVSRRFMGYMWRYLRRPVPEGPLDALDLDATIDQAARNGALVHPVYRRRLVNQARLILLLDHMGSMMPFHRYLRDLVETIGDSAVGTYEVYYFQNVPGDYVYHTPYLTEPRPLTNLLATLDNRTSVLIVSDAGAARRHKRNMQRMQDSVAFLYQLQAHTRLIAWLNPLPEARWTRTTAEIIARSVPMFPMDEFGFSGALDVLSGRTRGREV